MEMTAALQARRLEAGSSADPPWACLLSEAAQAARREPALSRFLHGAVLSHRTFAEAVVARIADRLHGPTFPGALVRQAYGEFLTAEPSVADAFCADIVAVLERDPATRRCLEPLLYDKGFHAIETHRLAHWLWRSGRTDFALLLQSLSAQVFQTDIHPAVRLGKGIFLDHATGLVIGETALVEDDVSILQGVTLGGTGKDVGDRHPKIRRGVLIAAGAKILGNIEVGPCSRIGAGAVVLRPVPPRTTVAGVPARIIGECGCPEPSRSMDAVAGVVHP